MDVSFQYLSFFLESDEELETIRQDYLGGRLLTGELKARCIKELQEFVAGFQARRKAVTESVVDEYMKPRPLVWGESRKAAAAAAGGEAEKGLKERLEDLASQVKETVL